MTRNLDIAQIDARDSIDLIARKVNHNFSQLLRSSVTLEKVETIVDDNKPPDQYPIGSVIATKNPHDPRLSIGTWQQIAQDKFIMAAMNETDVGQTGGSATDEITISKPNLPSLYHTHDMPIFDSTKEGDGTGVIRKLIPETMGQTQTTGTDPGGTSTPITVDTIPPYYKILFFERVG
jgi:hypothetical protein